MATTGLPGPLTGRVVHLSTSARGGGVQVWHRARAATHVLRWLLRVRSALLAVRRPIWSTFNSQPGSQSQFVI